MIISIKKIKSILYYDEINSIDKTKSVNIKNKIKMNSLINLVKQLSI